MKTTYLPRLLYVSDARPEPTGAGGTILYRLLCGYPADRLLVVSPAVNTQTGLPGRQILLEYGIRGFGRRGFREAGIWWNMLLTNTIAAKSVRSLARSFRPDAILSVAHGYLFFAGFKVAKSLGVPFHLIIHDDWPTTMTQGGLFAQYLQRRFRKIYRGASTRLCLSRYMLEEYQNRYGRSGDYLPPLQEEALPDQEELARSVSGFREFVVAYAGSLWTADYVRLLEILASVLRSQTWGPERVPGYLDIYTHHDAVALSLAQRYSPCVRPMPFLSPVDLIKRLRSTATLTFVPMSFQPSDQATVRVAFPSKLADLTAAGTPILVCGPTFASAVRWAKENHCALVIETDHPEALAQGLHEVARDSTLRSKLAARAIRVGAQEFSYDMVRQRFYRFLNSKSASDTRLEGRRSD